MENPSNQMLVVKISTALSNQPIFVRINEPTISIENIFIQAISEMRNSGKPLEATQLEELFKQHQIFNNGKVVQKGHLFSELSQNSRSINNIPVQIVELDLISSHRGGLVLKCNRIEFTRFNSVYFFLDNRMVGYMTRYEYNHLCFEIKVVDVVYFLTFDLD